MKEGRKNNNKGRKNNKKVIYLFKNKAF